MGTGMLRVSVYAENIGQPVKGALIIISGNGVNMTLRSDENGGSEEVALKCPDKKYSLEKQRKVRPYSRYVIKVKKEGLRSAQINGTQILDGETALQNVFLRSGAETEPDAVDIPEHTLWGDYPPPKNMPASDEEEDEKGPPELPQYLFVHCGTPGDAAAGGRRVPFADYLKNVASAGIYATWPPEAVKANVHAILSFTFSRLYNEWYPSKDYRFDVTSDAAYDQLYVPGGQVFLSLSQAVDEVLCQYIRRSGRAAPFCARCDDGARFEKPGCLSKWGSKDLGERGLSALQILRRYYGGEISLESRAPEKPLEVRRLQAMLNIVAASYPAIPRIAPADGQNGEEPEKALRAFQHLFRLPESGEADFATRFHLSHVYKSVLEMLRGRYIF